MVRWKDMKKVRRLHVFSTSFHAYEAFLRQHDGHYVHVFFKLPKTTSEAATASLRHEARVLQTLQCLNGIPLLYGVTRRPRMALVMGYCNGNLLGDFLRPQTPRTYLGGLLRLCFLLREMHAKGVSHGNLYPCHIFLERSLLEDTNVVVVSVAGFNRARLNALPQDKQYDAATLAMMAQDIEQHIPPNHAMYRRRGLLQTLLRHDIPLQDIVKVLTQVLYGRKPPAYP